MQAFYYKTDIKSIVNTYRKQQHQRENMFSTYLLLKIVLL